MDWQRKKGARKKEREERGIQSKTGKARNGATHLEVQSYLPQLPNRAELPRGRTLVCEHLRVGFKCAHIRNSQPKQVT